MYLIDGILKSWDGPTRQVLSPVWIQGPAGIEPYRIGSHPLLDENSSMEALDAARNAFNNGRGFWPSISTEDRIEHFEMFLSAMKSKRKEVAKLLMWEIGKTHDDSLKEFDRTIAYIRNTIRAVRKQERAAQRIGCEQGIMGKTRRMPLGVALCMGPFNYPLYETFTVVAPALLTGNTVIFKPPRYGSLLFGPLLEILRDTFPAGVVNVIFGDGARIIPPLMSSGRIDMLAFIGTSGIADYLKKLHPGSHRLRSTLGLEAKNPAIVLPDVDLDVTIKESVMGALGFNGQRCAALKIFFVHRSIADVFLNRMAEKIARLRCGMPWEKDVSITPLSEPDKVSYLTGLIADAVHFGAEIMNNSYQVTFKNNARRAPGRRGTPANGYPDAGVPRSTSRTAPRRQQNHYINEGNLVSGVHVEGSLFCPAILYPVNERMRIYHEEQFGPIIPVVPYDDIEECLRYVIASSYGQQASVFGRDRETLTHLVDILSHHVSRVNINCKCQRTPDGFPFTGRKDSAEGVLSVSDALLAFTAPVSITARRTERDKQLFLAITKEKL